MTNSTQGNLSEADKNTTDENYNDGAGPELPDLGYWMGLYAVAGVDVDKLALEIEPSEVPPQQIRYRLEGRVTPDQAGVKDAARLHPMRCAKNKQLCRDMFLIADSEEYIDRGLLFVHIDWDKKVDDQSIQTLAEKGTRAKIETRRLPVHINETATLFNMVVKGYVPFKSSAPTFIFYDETHDHNSNSIRWLDRAAYKRVAGTEQFLEGSLVGEVLTREEIDKHLTRWQQVIRRHPLQVYKYRFCATLQPQYFVFSEKEIKDVRGEVVLGKTAWNGSPDSLTKKQREGVDLPDGVLEVTTIRCAASEAYKVLTAIVEGKRTWTPESSNPN